MIKLELTNKEAIVFHMLYTIGSMALAGDKDYDIIRYAMTVSNFLHNNIDKKEQEILVDKVSQMMLDIPIEIRKQFGVLSISEENIPIILDSLERTQFDRS